MSSPQENSANEAGIASQELTALEQNKSAAESSKILEIRTKQGEKHLSQGLENYLNELSATGSAELRDYLRQTNPHCLRRLVRKTESRFSPQGTVDSEIGDARRLAMFIAEAAFETAWQEFAKSDNRQADGIRLEQPAFEFLCLLTHKTVDAELRRFVERHPHCSQQSHDLTQTAYIRAIEYLCRGEIGANVKGHSIIACVRKIAIHTAVSLLRGEHVRTGLPSSETILEQLRDRTRTGFLTRDHRLFVRRLFLDLLTTTDVEDALLVAIRVRFSNASPVLVQELFTSSKRTLEKKRIAALRQLAPKLRETLSAMDNEKSRIKTIDARHEFRFWSEMLDKASGYLGYSWNGNDAEHPELEPIDIAVAGTLHIAFHRSHQQTNHTLGCETYRLLTEATTNLAAGLSEASALNVEPSEIDIWASYLAKFGDAAQQQVFRDLLMFPE